MTVGIIFIYDSNCAEGSVLLMVNTQDELLMYCCTCIQECRGHKTSIHIIKKDTDLHAVLL